MRARLLALVALLATVFAAYAFQHSTAAVGRPAPGFTLADASGRSFTLQSLRGRVVLLDFWASWCTVCRQDAPALRTFAERYGDRVAVVGVDWREPESALRQWVREFGLRYPNLRDGSGTVARKYGLDGVPEEWWIAPDGTARLHFVGPADFEQLQQQYQAVTGSPIDASARPSPRALAAGPDRLWVAAGGAEGGLWIRPVSGVGAWTRADLPGPFQAVAVSGGTVMAAGTAAGWVASEDGGAHWLTVPAAAAGPVAALAADASTPGAFYAWAGGRLLRAGSATGGFSPVPGQPPVGAGDAVLALAARGPDLLVATRRGILVSSDGGAHWRASGLERTPLGSQEFATATEVMADKVPLVATGAVIAPDGTTYLAGPDGVYAAAQGGGGPGDRLPAAPARAVAAVARQADGTLWAVAPNGDLYAAASPAAAWRLVGAVSGAGGAA